MIPVMGFCQLMLFGGYAIYFPELFPTRLPQHIGARRSATTCGRSVAAVGPMALALPEQGQVYRDEAEPYRLAGVTMCGVFLIGLAVLPFLPETQGRPLPE